MNKKGEKKAGHGGNRPNSGRKLLNKKTKKIKINQFYYDTIKNHIERLKTVGGKYISVQDYCSQVIIKVHEQADERSLKEFASDLAPGGQPWATLTLTESAYQKLEDLVNQISPLSPVYTNLSNVFTVVLLKQVREQRKSLKTEKD